MRQTRANSRKGGGKMTVKPEGPEAVFLFCFFFFLVSPKGVRDGRHKREREKTDNRKKMVNKLIKFVPLHPVD